MNRMIALSLWLALLTSTAGAQGFEPPQVLTAHAALSQTQAAPGSELEALVVVKILPGLHINSNTPSDESLIPTVLSWQAENRLTFGRSLYPDPEWFKFSFMPEKISVYQGEVKISTRLQVSPQAAPGKVELRGELTFQGCNDASCFPPDKVALAATLEIVPAGAVTADPAGKPDQLTTAGSPDPAATGAAALKPDGDQPAGGSAPAPGAEQRQKLELTREEQRAMDIIEHGLIYAMAAFFIIGLALNLTPCVYPVIPLTVSYFGGQSGRSRGSSFVAALFYLLGIALSFALLGILSGLAGKQWGFLFQSPWFVAAIVTIILLMAASMFGAFEISVPTALLTRFGGAREGVAGALIMGLTVGVIIAPCAAGIIIGLVGLVAKLGLVAKGGLLFFVMGLGLGLPYLVLATFSGLLDRLPQSGVWMLWIKKFFGFLLIGVALYFITPQLGLVQDRFLFLAGLLGIVSGLLLGFIGQEAGTRGFTLFRRAAGLVVILLALNWINEAIKEKASELPWVHYRNQSLAELTAAGKPVFIDFYADWCLPCKELDKITFRDSAVQEQLAQFTLVKVNCTKPDERIKLFQQQFGAFGMPTLVFLTPSGAEIEELRQHEFVPPEKFLALLQRALQSR